MAFPTRALTLSDELSMLQQLSPGSTVSVMTVDSGRGMLVPTQVVGPAAARLRNVSIDIGYHVSGWVAAHWVPMVNADAQLDLDVVAQELRYALSMPLLHRHRLAGVLTIYSAEAFGDAVLQRVEMLMPRLAESLDAPDEARIQDVSRNLRLVARH